MGILDEMVKSSDYETDLLNRTIAGPDLSPVDDMFASPVEATTQKQIESMAIFVAVEDDALEKIQKEHDARKANLDQLKSDLCLLMKQNGMESVKLANGLTPKAIIKTKFFKQAGITDEQLFDWLNTNNLGDIIKPTVNFNTMQSTLKMFNGEIPEAIFNVTDVPTITMYGKSKFLANRATPLD